MRKLDMETVRKAIRDSSATTEIYIGCDSIKTRDNKSGRKMVEYARVVILHIDGKHGCHVYGDCMKEPDYGSLRARLMREVQLATDLAYDLLEDIGERPLGVHLDINKDPKEGSHIAMKEAAGYVRGMLGIEATFKPDAFAASCAADRLVR